MTEDFQHAVTAAVGDGPHGALRVLLVATTWAARELRHVAERGDGDDALEAVIRIDDALTQLGAIRPLLPALLARADAGADVADYLRDRAAELEELGARTAAARREHDELLARREQIDARVAEHAELMGQVVDLRRLERLADVLDDLALQRTVIARRLDAIRTPVAEAEQAIERHSTELITLTEQARQALEPRVRSAVEQAAKAQADLQAMEATLREQEAAHATSMAGFEAMRTEYDTRLADLRVHADADRLVAAALPDPDVPGPDGVPVAADGLRRARQELDAIEARLGAVETALADALGDQARRTERSPIPWA